MVTTFISKKKKKNKQIFYKRGFPKRDVFRFKNKITYVVPNLLLYVGVRKIIRFELAHGVGRTRDVVETEQVNLIWTIKNEFGVPIPQCAALSIGVANSAGGAGRTRTGFGAQRGKPVTCVSFRATRRPAPWRQWEAGIVLYGRRVRRRAGRFLGNRVGRARKSSVSVAVDTGRPYSSGPAAVGERRRRVYPGPPRTSDMNAAAGGPPLLLLLSVVAACLADHGAPDVGLYRQFLSNPAQKAPFKVFKLDKGTARGGVVLVVFFF